MKRILYTLLLTTTTVFMYSFMPFGSVSAHVLKQDNGIFGVLHIPPEDNPEAGVSTELDVSFGNSANTFAIANCACKVQVKSNDQIIQTSALMPYFSGATLDTKATVTFPAANVYDVIVQGSSKNGTFHSFKLDYLVRVVANSNSSNAPANSQGYNVAIIGAGSIVIVFIIGSQSIKSGGRYNEKSTKPRIRRKK